MSNLWAISDLHLSFGVGEKKSMNIFGERWENHHEKIETQWKKNVFDNDIVIIAGDISWAMKKEEAIADLEWIHSLPGQKIILKGNHDYWWCSNKQMKAMLPPSINFINKNSWSNGTVSIAGSRLWQCQEISCDSIAEKKQNSKLNHKDVNCIDDEVIFEKELSRLIFSLKQLDPQAKYRIAITHFPPINNDLETSKVSEIFESFSINFAIFGHLHNVINNSRLFGEKNGIQYHLTSCDCIDFSPKFIFYI